MARSHAIDGTLLSTVCIEEGVVFTVADVAGKSVSIPYQPHMKPGTRTLKGAAYQLLLSLKGEGDTAADREADYYEKTQALAALIVNADTDGYPQPFVLTRILPFPGGDQTCTINAIYRDGLTIAEVGPDGARSTPTLELLDSWWLNGSTKVFL